MATRPIRRHALWGSASALVICIATATFAALAQSNDGVIESAVVSAEKRSQNIQDVPASVSVLTGDGLANMHATSLQDMEGYIPGLNIQPFGSAGLEFVT